MGRVRPKSGHTPFKLDIDKLMQTEGNMGDVLARLIDAAGDASHSQKTRDAGIDWDATYEQVRRDRGEA